MKFVLKVRFSIKNDSKNIKLSIGGFPFYKKYSMNYFLFTRKSKVILSLQNIVFKLTKKDITNI